MTDKSSTENVSGAHKQNLTQEEFLASLAGRPNRPEAAFLATAFKKPLFINALQICMLPEDLEKVADRETLAH